MLLPTTQTKIENKYSNPNSYVQEFQEDYGVIPDQISRRGITISSFAVESVIWFGIWVYDYPVSSFHGLIDIEDIYLHLILFYNANEACIAF